jgi:hypothetical protein
VQGDDRSVPVDGGHRGGAATDAGPGLDEAAGEVVAVQERGVGVLDEPAGEGAAGQSGGEV